MLYTIMEQSSHTVKMIFFDIYPFFAEILSLLFRLGSTVQHRKDKQVVFVIFEVTKHDF